MGNKLILCFRLSFDIVHYELKHASVKHFTKNFNLCYNHSTQHSLVNGIGDDYQNRRHEVGRRTWGESDREIGHSSHNTSLYSYMKFLKTKRQQAIDTDVCLDNLQALCRMFWASWLLMIALGKLIFFIKLQNRKLLFQYASRSPPACYYCMNNKNKTKKPCFTSWPPEGRLGSILEW